MAAYHVEYHQTYWEDPSKRGKSGMVGNFQSRVNDGQWSLYIDLRCLFKILFKMKYLGTDWLGSEGRNRHRTGALAKATAVV